MLSLPADRWFVGHCEYSEYPTVGTQSTLHVLPDALHYSPGPTVPQQTFRVRSAVACGDTARNRAVSTQSTHYILRVQQHLRSVVACLVTACEYSEYPL